MKLTAAEGLKCIFMQYFHVEQTQCPPKSNGKNATVYKKNSPFLMLITAFWLESDECTAFEKTKETFHAKWEMAETCKNYFNALFIWFMQSS